MDIRFYNWGSQTWSSPIHTQTIADTSEAVREFTLSSGFSNYVDTSNGNKVRAKVTWTNSTDSNGFQVMLDSVEWGIR